MAKIFLAHSRHDEDVKNLFLRAFSGSGVGHVLKEYEQVSGAQPGVINRNIAEQIEEDIMMSAAVFVILTETVQRLPNTAHWIIYECSQAKAKQKPVWVFEPYDSYGKIDITIPRYDHYVRFPPTEDARRFIQNVAAHYTDKPMLGLAAGAAAGGAAVGPVGALIGGALGYFIGGPRQRPKGFSFNCVCALSYEVHLPGGRGKFRCLHCKQPWAIT